MKKAALSLLLLVALASCGDRQKTAYYHEEIRTKASESYAFLVKGQVDRYLSQINGFSSLPEAQRTQLRDMFEQYLERERTDHKGLVASQVIGDTILSDSTADAFVRITFGDGTVEQISLPMVRVNEEWLLK